MTRYRIIGAMLMKFANREKLEGADDINGTILVRRLEPGTVELMDPNTLTWHKFTDCTTMANEASVTCEGDESLPTYAKEMTI